MSTRSENDANLTALRGGVERLATQLVLEGVTGVAPESLAQLERLAHDAGFAEIGSVAHQAREQLGTASRDDAEESLSAALIRMQEILSAPPALDRPAGDDAPDEGGPLADDPAMVRDFIVECREHLSAIETRMLEIERNPRDTEAIHTVFRAFHTIKGLAGFLDLTDLHEVAHETETVLDRARNGGLEIVPETVDVILAAADYVKSRLGELDAANKTGAALAVPDNRALLARVRACAAGQRVEPAEASAPAPSAETSEQSAPAKDSAPAAARPADGESRLVRVDTTKLDHLVDMAGEMIIAESMVRQHPDLAAACTPALARALVQLSRITAELQRTAMSMRMEPIGGLFQRISRLVRDAARKNGKTVSLKTVGAETELDRNIVEELADPLMHMVRNSIDHGIEPPDQRRAAGKDTAGTITLRASHQAGHIVVEVADDGRGLDREKILARARAMGFVREDETPSDSEVFNFIFRPGFSTAERVTDISGRGVGMDVVRKHIQNLRGRVDIHSTPGEGTRFLLRLPLTLAIIDALIAGVGRERYVIPLHSVREMFRPPADMVFTVENRREMALVRGTLYPVVRLGRALGVEARAESPEQGLFIITEAGGRVFCLMVDELIGKQEVVIKTLGEMLDGARGVAGAAILGDGRVRMIVDLESVAGMEFHG